MKKLWAEFKTFISRGNVMDLAVGMIIGSAFTAIINALVKNILTPLINAIPGSGATGALQTVLREAVVDESGNVVTEALILDWGAVIGAVVTFLLTAAVLFLIVKAFNRFKETGGKLKSELEKAVATAKKEERREETEKSAAEEKPAVQSADAEAKPTDDEYKELLKQIVELLKESGGRVKSE